MGARSNFNTHVQEDMLSKLPNDILVAILERLDIRDAARISTLSRRLSQIPAMLNKLAIKVTSFEPYIDDRSKITLDDLTRANATMHEVTKSILSRRDNQHTIHLLCLQFYLGEESISIGQTVVAAMETQTIDSAEFTISTKKGRDQCDPADVLFNGSDLMLLFNACPNAFGGLTCLKLENVRLNESDLPNIFGTCKRLQFLRMYNCDMGVLSSLEVEHPRLSKLEVDHCRFRMVHLKLLPKLTVLTFEMWIAQQVPLCFGYVPLLSSVTLTNIAFWWHDMVKLSKVLDSTTISTLQLNFRCEKVWVQPECPERLLPVFLKLRIAKLINISEECDLNWTMFILQGAPFLEELHLMVRDHFCEMVTDKERRKLFDFSEEKKGVDWEGAQSGFKHHKLAVLKIFGFRPEDRFVTYVRSVINAAVNLQGVFLFNKVVCEKCERWVPKASRSPWPKKQRFSLRNRITSGMSSFVAIHFPNSSKD